MSLLFASVFFCFVREVFCHARLIEPPSRTSAWRFGFDNPPNYNDHETNCGGFSRQWSKNGGKCGMCGDAWDLPQPRAGEAGGKYGRGVIVRNYQPGQMIKVTVDVTANHKGYFQFRLCDNPNSGSPAHESCFNKNVLKISDGTDKFYIGTGTGTHSVRVKLPEVRCDTCVLQWQYVAGNNWGTCPDGSGKVGCGPQEEFRACADISIGGTGNGILKPGNTISANNQGTGGKPWYSGESWTVRPNRPRPTTSTTQRPTPSSSWWPWTWSWSWSRPGTSVWSSGTGYGSHSGKSYSYLLSSLTKRGSMYNLTSVDKNNTSFISEGKSFSTMYNDLCKLAYDIIVAKISNMFNSIFSM